MDTHTVPQKQAAMLGHNDAYPDRVRERRAENGAVVDLDNPVAAFTLLGFIGALELDQVWVAGSLLTELEPTVDDLKVGVALPDLAVVLCAEGSAYLQ